MTMLAPNTKTEVLVGAFVALGLAALAYLSISIGGLQLFPPERYLVRARFESVGDLKTGAPIRIAGVKVGQVTAVSLKEYQAETQLLIDRAIVLPKDTTASIRSEGLLGDTYVSLSPGGSLENLRGGGVISHTEPALDLTDLLARYAFGQRSGASEQTPAAEHRDRDDALSDPLK